MRGLHQIQYQQKKEIETRDIRGDVFGYVKDSNNRIKRRIGKC